MKGSRSLDVDLE